MCLARRCTVAVWLTVLVVCKLCAHCNVWNAQLSAQLYNVWTCEVFGEHTVWCRMLVQGVGRFLPRYAISPSTRRGRRCAGPHGNDDWTVNNTSYVTSIFGLRVYSLNPTDNTFPNQIFDRFKFTTFYLSFFLSLSCSGNSLLLHFWLVKHHFTFFVHDITSW